MIGSIIADAIRPFVDAGVDIIRSAVSWRNATLDSRTRLTVADKESDAALAEAKLRVLVAREQLEVVTREAKLDRDHEKQLAAFFAKASEMRQREEHAARRWLFEEQRKLQRELESFRAEIQLHTAEIHHRALLDSVEFGVFLQQLPIRSVPSVLLPRYAEYQRERARMPLMVIISPPEVDGDPSPVSHRLAGIDTLLAGRLGELLARYSGPAERIHFVDGAWKTKAMWGETAFQNLYEAFKPIPTLVLESRIEGDHVHIRFAMWLGNTRMRQGDLGLIPIHSKKQLVSNEDEPPKKKQRQRKQSSSFEVTQELANTLATHHALAAAWFADAYHLSAYGQPPILPLALSSIMPDATDETVRALLDSLGQVPSRIGVPTFINPALIAVAIARSLAEAGQTASALTQLKESVSLWLELNGGTPQKKLDFARGLAAVASVGDLEFLLAVRAVAQRAGDQNLVLAADRARLQIPAPELPEIDDGGETVYGNW